MARGGKWWRWKPKREDLPESEGRGQSDPEAGQASVERVRELMRQGAEAGDPRAMVYHGMYLTQMDGNHAEAEFWFTAALAAGNVTAAGELGKLLMEQGSYADAKPLLRVGAEAGDTEAMVGLGILLLWDDDRVGARALVSAAADGDHEGAQELLLRIDAGWNGIDEEQDGSV
ncbi:hypothetical protein [Streptomyces sp. NPDC002588]|uniref:hypothetical protein n=1 Tax=Streptomyces sp. NPDC002588 TaxID=3154419 RepID=UPI00331D3193